jgi:hypothetical protein
VVSDADMVKAESDGYAPDLPSITLDHHQRARDEVCCTGVTVSEGVPCRPGASCERSGVE